MSDLPVSISEGDLVAVHGPRRARIPAGAIRWKFSRSGGPGGQNVNKVSSRAELWVALADIAGLDEGAMGRLRVLAGRRLTAAGDLHLSDEHSRSQRDNQQRLLDRLAEMLGEALIAPTPRRKTRPGQRARQRRLENKRRRSAIKANRRMEGE